jgi:hypothetical protein
MHGEETAGPLGKTDQRADRGRPRPPPPSPRSSRGHETPTSEKSESPYVACDDGRERALPIHGSHPRPRRAAAARPPSPRAPAPPAGAGTPIPSARTHSASARTPTAAAPAHFASARTPTASAPTHSASARTQVSNVLVHLDIVRAHFAFAEPARLVNETPEAVGARAEAKCVAPKAKIFASKPEKVGEVSKIFGALDTCTRAEAVGVRTMPKCMDTLSNFGTVPAARGSIPWPPGRPAAGGRALRAGPGAAPGAAGGAAGVNRGGRNGPAGNATRPAREGLGVARVLKCGDSSPAQLAACPAAQRGAGGTWQPCEDSSGGHRRRPSARNVVDAPLSKARLRAC